MAISVEEKTVKAHICSHWREPVTGDDSCITDCCKLFDLDKIELMQFVDFAYGNMPEHRSVLNKMIKKYLEYAELEVGVSAVKCLIGDSNEE